MLCNIPDQQWWTLPHPNVWSSQLTNDGGQQQKFQWGSIKILCLFFTLNLDLEEKRMERSNCTVQLTKGASQSRLCRWGRERTQPTGWRNKEKLTGLCIWIVWLQAQLDPGAHTKPFNICLFPSFSSGFPLCSLHSWAICLCGGFSNSRPKTYQKEFLPPNTSRRSLLAFLFWVWPRSQAHRWPTHCGQGSGVCGMAMLGSWTHTWAREQGCLLTSQGWQ